MSRRSSSSACISERFSSPSRTTTWQVVHAQLPPQLCSSGMSWPSAMSRSERGRDAATLVLADEMTALAERAAHVGQDRVGLVARFDEESRADVGLGVLERLLDHALHVGLGQAVRRLHLDRRGLTGALLPGG